MKKNLGMLMAMMSLAAMGGTGSGNPYMDSPTFSPGPIDTTKHEASKQGQKMWVVNGKRISAATKKAAIKKYKQQEPDYLPHMSIVVGQL